VACIVFFPIIAWTFAFMIGIFAAWLVFFILMFCIGSLIDSGYKATLNQNQQLPYGVFIPNVMTASPAHPASTTPPAPAPISTASPPAPPTPAPSTNNTAWY